MLRITALEEHFVTRAVVDAWRSVDACWQDLALGLSSQGPTARRLLNIGADRITEMDDAGITVQVLSPSTPGLAMLAPADAIALQSMTNDQLAEATRTRHDRLQGLATVATPVPEKAAQELPRPRAAQRLYDWTVACIDSGVPEIGRLAHTISTWRAEFLAYFSAGRISNGPILLEFRAKPVPRSTCSICVARVAAILTIHFTKWPTSARSRN